MQRLNDVISFIRIRENMHTALVVRLTDIGEADLARAAIKKTRTESLLLGLDLHRHCTGRHIELAAGCCESASLRNFHEGRHTGHAVHDDFRPFVLE